MDAKNLVTTVAVLAAIGAVVIIATRVSGNLARKV